MPGCGHEMMSGRGRFNRTAHSLTLVRYSPSHPFPRITAAAIPRAVLISSFSRRASSDPLAPLPSSVPWVRLPHRRHLSSPRVIIALPPSRPSSRPAWSVAGRCYPYCVVRSLSARRGQASRRAGVAMMSSVPSVSWRAWRAVASSSVPSVSKQADRAMSSMSSMSSARARSSSPGVSSHRSERAGRRHPCRGASKQATAAVSSSLRLVCRLVGASRLIPPGRPVRR